MNDNEMLHLLDDEREFMPTKKRFMDRLETKDIRPGHSRLIRFLPVEQGPKKTYWMRYGAHWIQGSRPLWCPRSTSIDAGGKGKNAECPLCDLAAELNGHSDEKISGMGYRLSANPFWRTFVLVRGKSDGDDMEPVPSPKCFVPLEFNLSQQLFNDFIADYRDNMDLGPMSFMDPMNGFNHILTVKGRIPSIRISSKVKPICKEADYDDVINSIFGAIILQQNKIASYNDLELAASKAEERIMNGGRGGDDDDRDTRRRSDDREYSRRRDPGDYDEDDDRPRRRSRDDDSERSERVQEDREDRRDDRREADEERPSRPARPVAPKAPPRSVERHEISSDDQDGDDRDSGRAAEKEVVDDDIDTSPSPAPAKAPAPSLPPRSAPAKTPPSVRAPLPPPPAAKTTPTSSKIDEDDGDLPEESRDPAPPRKMDEAALGAVLDENAPPPVASQGSSAKPRAGLSDRLRRSLAVQDTRS